MASLILHKNPLSPHDFERFILDDGERPVDWLQRHYPEGCGGALRYYVNGGERDLDDLDYQPAPDDVVMLAVHPAGLEPIYISIIVSVALAAASFAIQKLFFQKPTAPGFSSPDNAEASPVYSVRSNQNTARLAEPIPVVYGNVLHTPDICAQPYKFYPDDKQEYFDMLLCLGVGDFTVNQILIGDTDVNAIAAGSIQTHVAVPAFHGGTIGTLRDVFGVENFNENMLTSVEVGEQEFYTTGDTAGYFRLGKSGQIGQFLWVDMFFPKGLYQINEFGDVVSTIVDWQVDIVEADAGGNPIGGTEQTFVFSQGTAAGVDPLRHSYGINAGHNASWLVKLTRITEQYPNGKEVNLLVWGGLRMQVYSPGGGYYGNVTLLAARIRATAINTAANFQVRVRLQRNLPPAGIGAAVPTNSPADAFADILTNADYGARRPIAEVDTTRLAALRSWWNAAGYSYGFNAVYTGKSTIWKALSDCLAVVAAAPLPVGGFMSVAQDGIKNVRTMLFTEQNIVAESFSLTYSFDTDGDNDGVEVEYRNPATFAPAFVRYPAGSDDPEKLTLFGCSDARQASEFAVLSWQRRIGNRRAVAFTTEMEGLIPLLGERAAIAHTLPRWGQSGFVVAVDGLSVTLDRNLDWNEPTLVPPYVAVFRDQYGSPSNVVQVTHGSADNVLQLASNPWAGTSGGWELDPNQELTHFAFGDGTRAVKDFILTTLAPADKNQVNLGGTYYDPTVYSGSFAFFANPVP